MALSHRWNKRMLRAPHLIAALLMMALSPAALAQKSSGHMDLDDLSSVYGAQLAGFRVMISKTDVICPSANRIVSNCAEWPCDGHRGLSLARPRVAAQRRQDRQG